MKSKKSVSEKKERKKERKKEKRKKKKRMDLMIKDIYLLVNTIYTGRPDIH